MFLAHASMCWPQHKSRGIVSDPRGAEQLHLKGLRCETHLGVGLHLQAKSPEWALHLPIPQAAPTPHPNQEQEARKRDLPVIYFKKSRPTNPCTMEHLAFQPMCSNICHICQPPSVFASLLASILQKGAEVSQW